MTGFATTCAVAITRRNPVMVPRRDLLVMSTDTPVLSATIYQFDTDAVPIDVTQALFSIAVYRERDFGQSHGWDYGFGDCSGFPWLLATFPGVVVDGPNGRVDFSPVGSLAQYVVGRLWYELVMQYPPVATTGIGVRITGPATINYAVGNMTLCNGVMDFRRGAAVPVSTTPVPGLLDAIGVG